MPAQYRRVEETVWRHAHRTVLVLPVWHRDVLALDGAGAELWQLLAEPLTVDEAAHRLAEVYNARSDVIARDIAPLLDELADRGVLKRLDHV